MANIDRAFIDQVLSSTDIVDLIKEKLISQKMVQISRVCVLSITKKHLPSMFLHQNNSIIALVVVPTAML